jgi:N-acetylglucosamine kinase-like BadF-type ATPase
VTTLVLGVDGGNSKAIALVARDDGTIVGAGRQLGSADIYAGFDAALDVVRAAVEMALAEAGATRDGLGRAVFSLAGADWPEDIAGLRRAFERDGFGGPVEVVNDGIGALTAAVPHGPAVVVSLGTGAATGARGPDGATWHSSFWQSPHGADELARTAVSAVARGELGIRPATRLRDDLLGATGDRDVEALLHRITARARPEATAVTGALVRALFAAAAAGDGTAGEIVDRHGAGIGEVAAAAARRVGADRESYALSFCGGLARAGAERLVAAAVSAVRRAGQDPSRVAPRWEPAVGALVIGLRPSPSARDSIADRLDASMPPASVFAVL